LGPVLFLFFIGAGGAGIHQDECADAFRITARYGQGDVAAAGNSGNGGLGNRLSIEQLNYSVGGEVYWCAGQIGREDLEFTAESGLLRFPEAAIERECVEKNQGQLDGL